MTGLVTGAVMASALFTTLTTPVARASNAHGREARASSTPASSASRPGSAGASMTAGRTGPPVRVRQPPDSLPGIDVSHWQNTIDWTQVAASGVRFAFVKATDGRSYVDPMYEANRAGAAAAGVTIGAYHYARPDRSANDAIAEADHFVDVAAPAPGDLLPVLDLEVAGGLSTEEITAWTLAWLNEVTLRTGVKPIVYTSPNGWINRTADTTAIADAGYTVLWVAHWNVATPTVPANNWQGYGWTFWQYSNCGSVPGIQGCVDLDWFNGLTFDSVTVPSPDTIPPVASVAAPTGVAQPVRVSFSEIVRGLGPSNVALRVADTGADVPVTRTCLSKDGRTVDCATGKVLRVTLQPVDALIPGETYAAVVNPADATSPVVDRSGNVATPTEQGVAMPTEVEQGSPAVRYGWRTFSKPGTYGGSYAAEHLEGATASFTFTGTQVTWYTLAGPTQGKATVSIDGRPRGSFDQYAPSIQTKVARSFRGLAPGSHTITVRVLGQGAPGAVDTQVAIDAFRAGGRVTWTPALAASWRRIRVAGASRGSVVVNDAARSSVSFRFRGTGVAWQTVRGPAQGRAQIFVDGVAVKTVDNYAPKTTAGIVRSVSGLADGVHELRIVVLGEARPAATGAFVSIDGFSVLPGVLP